MQVLFCTNKEAGVVIRVRTLSIKDGSLVDRPTGRKVGALPPSTKLQQGDYEEAVVMRRDISGQRFGMIVAIKDTGKRTEPGRNAIWLCRCECGKVFEVRGTNLTAKRRPQQSCGCAKSATISEKVRKHGGIHERLYGIWMGMRRRCIDAKIKDYPRYGGRDIKVCDEWQDYSKFREWSLLNGYDPNADFQKCTLDRIDSDGNYEPANCRWVDIKTQENNRRNNRIIEYQGKRMNVTMWAETLGINVVLLQDRLKHGWSFERAITEPCHKKKRFQQTSV